MKLNQKLSAIAIGVLSFTTMVSPALAEQWYFHVQNDSDVAITKIYVSRDNGKWYHFKLNNGSITPGATRKLIWYKSTNGDYCTQWIKAVFSDGSESKPEQFDFCQDLDDPIVFSE